MKNSYVSYVLGLYKAILADCQVRYPHLQLDFGRDYSRLLSCIESRGLSFVMIDLVDYGKHFDICLSNQRLTLSGLPCQRAYRKETPIPRLFKGLMLRIFDTSGMLRPDCDELSVRFLRQLLYVAKKLRVESSKERKEKVLQSFHTTDKGLRPIPKSWESDAPDWSYIKSVHLDQLVTDLPGGEDLPLLKGLRSVLPPDVSTLQSVQRAADVLTSLLGEFSPSQWKMKHGPGAVSDLRSETSKYQFPFWPQKLERVFPFADFGFANFGLWADYVMSEDSSRANKHEPPSKLILVPKTLKSPRLIASEPASHQWCQQALKDYFVHRCEKTLIRNFISFRDQVPNQVLASQGSIDQSLATIDLSEASDRISCYLVERMFRRSLSLIDALQSCRTRWVYNRTGQGTYQALKLNKFSCMGSACTFPVQSVIFLAVALGVVLHERRLRVTMKNMISLQGQVRVFGDDIIVPSTHADKVMEVLGQCGLVVNRSKTFVNGNFRESCGLDAFKGHDVTPAYVMTPPLRSKPESVVSAVETHNNFLARGWYNASDYLATAVRCLYSHIRNVVPGSGHFGLHAVGYVDNSHLETRFNHDLQRRELRTILLTSRSKRKRDEGDSMLLQYFTENPSPHTLWVGGVALRPALSLKRRWVGVE
jgi:hypothetical protein